MAKREPTLEELADDDVEQRFVEAERNALHWMSTGGRHAEHQGARWMQIAQACRAELDRRANTPSARRTRRRTPRQGRLAKALAKIAARPGVVPYEPATRIQVVDYAATLSYTVPPSYAELLGIHDGVAGCYGDGGDLLGTSYRGERDKEWEARLREQRAPPLRSLIFIAMDRGASVAVLDATTRKRGGEMQVLELSAGSALVRHASVVAWIEALAARA